MPLVSVGPRLWDMAGDSTGSKEMPLEEALRVCRCLEDTIWKEPYERWGDAGMELEPSYPARAEKRRGAACSKPPSKLKPLSASPGLPVGIRREQRREGMGAVGMGRRVLRWGREMFV